MRIPHTIALAALTICSPALAETITGQVVGPTGAPVAGVNIDLVNTAGTNIPLSGDITDANGMFTTTFTNPGTYDIHFVPANQTSGPFAITSLLDVVVNGTNNLGVVGLDAGATLSGQVLAPNGAGVAGINLDLIDANGMRREIGTDITNATGGYTVLVPQGNVELRFDPTGASTPNLAPKALDLLITGNANIGATSLETGFPLLAVIRAPNGTAVAGADLDAIDSSTGIQQYTPGDNTDNNGFVDLTLAAGTYDIEVCSPVSFRLVTEVLQGINVSGSTNLGIVTLTSGLMLSGTVTSAQGGPAAGVDLNVTIAGTSIQVPTCNDDTNAAGQYAVILPAGTYDLEFRDVTGGCTGRVVITGVVVNSDTVRNATLAPSMGSIYCSPAVPNSTGQPGVISAVGSCDASDNDVTLQIAQIATNQFGFFLNSLAEGFIANPGGSQGNLCLGGSIGRYNVAPFNSGSTGTASLVLDLPNTPNGAGTVAVIAGQTWKFQCWYRDLNPTNTSNFSNALSIRFE